MRPRSRPMLAGIVVLVALGVATALAKRPEGAPSGSMGVCKDGSYSFSRERRAACREQGGVSVWYRQADAAASGATAGSGPRQ